MDAKIYNLGLSYVQNSKQNEYKCSPRLNGSDGPILRALRTSSPACWDLSSEPNQRRDTLDKDCTAYIAVLVMTSPFCHDVTFECTLLKTVG